MLVYIRVPQLSVGCYYTINENLPFKYLVKDLSSKYCKDFDDLILEHKGSIHTDLTLKECLEIFDGVHVPSFNLIYSEKI